MAFSLRKRSRVQTQTVTIADNDTRSLGEVLHRSTKTKKKKNKSLTSDDVLRLPNIIHELSIRSSPSENRIIYLNKCLCDAHHDKQLAEHSYDLTVDKLFDLLFGSNEFVRTYRQAQRFYDDTATEWTKNETTNYRERILSYKVPYESTFVGKGTITTREKQILFHEVPGSHYMLETEVCNEGVKYSDSFSLNMRYCLVQTSPTRTNLLVTAQILYNKPLIGLMKQIIERSAYSASQEGLKDLSNRLNLIADFKTEKRRLSKNEVTLIVPTTEMVRRMSQHNVLPVYQSLLVDTNRNIQSSESDKKMYIVIFLVGILFFMHIYLYIKLKHIVSLVENLAHVLNINPSSNH